MLNKLSPYWLWILLAFPAIGMTFQLAASTDPELARELVHPTGEFAARFMIIAMLASPLVLLLRGWRGPQWLKKIAAILVLRPSDMRFFTRFSIWPTLGQ